MVLGELSNGAGGLLRGSETCLGGYRQAPRLPQRLPVAL